jgi:hypothetical protein
MATDMPILGASVIAMALIGFSLSVIGLAWCYAVIHRQRERERRRLTPEEILRWERVT